MFDIPTDPTKHDHQFGILLLQLHTLGLVLNSDERLRSGLGAALFCVVPILGNPNMGCGLYPRPARKGDANNIKCLCISSTCLLVVPRAQSPYMYLVSEKKRVTTSVSSYRGLLDTGRGSYAHPHTTIATLKLRGDVSYDDNVVIKSPLI